MNITSLVFQRENEIRERESEKAKASLERFMEMVNDAIPVILYYDEFRGVIDEIDRLAKEYQPGDKASIQVAIKGMVIDDVVLDEFYLYVMKSKGSAYKSSVTLSTNATNDGIKDANLRVETEVADFLVEVKNKSAEKAKKQLANEITMRKTWLGAFGNTGQAVGGKWHYMLNMNDPNSEIYALEARNKLVELSPEQKEEWVKLHTDYLSSWVEYQERQKQNQAKAEEKKKRMAEAEKQYRLDRQGAENTLIEVKSHNKVIIAKAQAILDEMKFYVGTLHYAVLVTRDDEYSDGVPYIEERTVPIGWRRSHHGKFLNTQGEYYVLRGPFDTPILRTFVSIIALDGPELKSPSESSYGVYCYPTPHPDRYGLSEDESVLKVDPFLVRDYSEKTTEIIADLTKDLRQLPEGFKLPNLRDYNVDFEDETPF